MVIWGAIWGAVLGLLWPGHDWQIHAVAGFALGALAGQMLRDAVRKEMAHRMGVAPPMPAAAQPAARPEPVRAAAPAAPRSVLVPPSPAYDMDAVPTIPDGLGEPAGRQPQLDADAVTGRSSGAVPQPADLLAAAFSRARSWLFGGNTVVRMGVLVLFVGLAFLAKYAIDHSVLPPQLRLAGIGATGIALFVAGFRLRSNAQDKLAYALTLQGAGVAVLYLTVFAAFRVYHFLPAEAAFAALALVCLFAAVIAVAQNAVVMAFIGFAGGFAAPLLVATGQDNPVGLFSYYLLLGVAIAGLAWVKAWRSLNLLGFFATFGVASLWGVLKYQPSEFAATEPFLIAFFLVYLTASLLYATRHSLAPRQAVDATLVFGTPLVAFVLQVGMVTQIEYAAAFSSLALGALYLGLGWWMAKRRAASAVHRWLAECFAALGLGFVTLAVPLALESRWTSAVWAVEGAAVFWLGWRQQRWLARAAGLALQVLGAIAFIHSQPHPGAALWPFANPGFIGGLLLALSAGAIAHWSRDSTPLRETRLQRSWSDLEHRLSPLLFWVAFLWWQYALHNEILRTDTGARIHLAMLAWVGSAFALHFLASPRRARPWTVTATPAFTVLPVLFLAAVNGMVDLQQVFASGGWLAWPIALVLHAVMLRRLDAGPPQAWWHGVHAGGVWLLVLLAGNLLVFAIGQAQLWHTAWATVILLVAAIAVLLGLSRRAWFDAARAGAGWPLGRFGRDYLWVAAAPLAVAVALGSLVVAWVSDGDARPLPYVPLLNPTDLSVALGLAACAMWLTRARDSGLAIPARAMDRRWMLALAGIGFVAINTVWLRIAHQYAGVAWDAGQLFTSFLVQAGYSILWTLIALVLMVGSHRRAFRAGWTIGAGLLGLTVLKLFVIDLSNRGGSERIFVFIAVGVLMLVVGYFAPLPPVRRTDAADGLKAARA
ncbi:MAG: hypothetical protein JWQ33_264 [Ramlibacter sp.]|nr:hypothetical protein [Ramlibacter sp.]